LDQMQPVKRRQASHARSVCKIGDMMEDGLGLGPLGITSDQQLQMRVRSAGIARS
jgi:hypothetical protein